VRDAIAEKEQLLAETRRVRSIMRSALDVLAEGAEADHPPAAEEPDRPSAPITPRLTGQSTPPAGVDRLAG